MTCLFAGCKHDDAHGLAQSGRTSPAVATPQATPVRPFAAGGATAVAHPAHAPYASGTGAPVPSPTAPPSQTPDPAILSAVATPSIVHSGDTVHWLVRTTKDVIAVKAQAPLYSFALAPSGAGRFALAFTVPAAAPPFFHGDYIVTIVGTTADGRSATTSLPVSFQ